MSHPAPLFRCRAVLKILAATAFLACSRQAPSPRPGPWNVVVLMIDTLRADHLDLYGYSRATAPHLAELARTGALLRNVSSQAGCTYPSVNSIFTSRWPQHFLNRQDTYGMAIPADTPTLAEILLGHGYSTAAVSTSVIACAKPSRTNPRGGFGQGFQTFDETCRGGNAACVNAKAEDLLDKLPQPFFLYLHYLDPHQPYQPPPSHARRFAKGASRHDWARRGDPGRLIRGLDNPQPRVRFGADDITTLSDLYDEEITYLDERLAELMADLREDGRLDDTIVVLLSDHGEELFDHQQWGHCKDLAYETVLRTPLLFWIPGGPRGVERSGQASNLDVVPTLLDFLGLPYDAKAFDGTSLRAVLQDDRPGNEVSFALQGTSRVASDGRYKIWLDLSREGPVVYDLRAGEQTPAKDFDRPAVNRLANALRAWIESEEGETRNGNLRRARENEAQLKALGYL